MSKADFSSKSCSENPFTFFITLLVLTLALIFWQIIQSPLIQILKSVVGGILLVYYTWEITYFDSQVPGIQPTSPLSPKVIRKESNHTLHLNYGLALINGAFFALFLNWWT